MTVNAAGMDRHIRVFVSSTFRDMHAERDHLVKFVFPELRRMCESRAVTWGEVDLRWGVTDEAAAEGKVLPVCLEEISRCRPYFIGLLGERYGWVPETIPAELVEREEWLGEAAREHKSVTELEILHGVLRNPAMADNAFFYFRDPGFIRSVPEKDRKDFLSEDAGDRAKLERLKERIRGSGLPVREGYRDPRALGELVLADLAAVIDRRWPESSVPDPLGREELDHAAYARSRERVYIGRAEHFARLDAHARGDGVGRPLILLGESGSGKSALLANWAARYRKGHPDELVLEHYISATPHSADWAAMLRRILGEFKKRLGLTQDIPDRPDALRNAFPNWLHMAAAKSRVVLVLDALNRLEDRDGAPDLVWLPPVMPENVRLVASTLSGRPLEEVERRGWPVFEIGLLSVDEREELIREFLADYGRVLGPGRLERIAAAPQTANPLYLRVLLDELRLFGRHERLDERIGHYLQAASPYELYGKVIARWEEDYGAGTGLVGDTLSLLWAARRGLTESELLQALGHGGRPLPRAAWSPLFLAMADALVSRNGVLTFAHDFLRTAARDAYLPAESQRREAHARLAEYFDRQPSSQRRTDELPWQMAEAQAWERLFDLLADRGFFMDAWKNNKYEVKAFWTRIEASSNLRMVEAYRRQAEHPEDEGDKDFLWRLGVLFADTGHLEEALRVRSELVEHYERIGNFDNLQAALGNRALILKARGDLDGAMALQKEKERICRRFGNQAGLQSSLCNQANILYARGDLDGAMALYEEQERICRRLGDLDSLIVSLCNQAGILYARGDLDRAMTLYEEQEQICRQQGHLAGLQAALGNRANILHERGDVDGAMALQKGKERICRQLGDLAGLQEAFGSQANILYASGDLEGAMALYKEQERICRQLDDPDGLQRTRGNQALVLKARGDVDGAVALWKEQERICRQLGNVEGLARSLASQALALRQKDRACEGLPLAEEAHRLTARHGYAVLAARIKPILDEVRRAAGARGGPEEKP